MKIVILLMLSLSAFAKPSYRNALEIECRNTVNPEQRSFIVCRHTLYIHSDLQIDTWTIGNRGGVEYENLLLPIPPKDVLEGKWILSSPIEGAFDTGYAYIYSENGRSEVNVRVNHTGVGGVSEGLNSDPKGKYLCERTVSPLSCPLGQ